MAEPGSVELARGSVSPDAGGVPGMQAPSDAASADAARKKRWSWAATALSAAKKLVATTLDEQDVAPALPGAASEPSSPVEPSNAPAVEPKAALCGHSSVLAVSELLGLLSSLHKSGRLTVWTDRECFQVRIERGAVISARAQAPGLMLGQILVLQGVVTEQDIARVLELRPDASRRVGDALKDAGLITDQQLRNAIAYQAQRIFDRAYALEDAWYRFDPSSENSDGEAGLSVTHLLLESARAKDEKEQRLENVLGDPFGAAS